MPMHDWTRVKAGTYHNFHFLWTSSLTNRLNAGLLPPGYFAMAEQFVGRPETDAVTLQAQSGSPPAVGGGGSTARSRPRTRFILPISEPQRYARKARRVAVRHELGKVVAVLEIVSPGNKDRKRSVESFVGKASDLIWQDVSMLIIDPFPPGPHDPQGINRAVCEELAVDSFELPADKPLTLAAYQVEPVKTAFVESIAVGDSLPDMPLFLEGDLYVSVPLEETYQATWDLLPAELRNLFND